jgi:hypothetical protein
LLAGCGSDSKTGLEGIYMVSTWTRNPTACDVEGPSVATQHDMFFYIKDEDFIGTHFVNVKTCNDLAACDTEANDDGTIHIGEFNFEDGSDKSGWKNHSAFAFATQGQCEGGVTDTTMTAASGAIRIEERHVEATPFPAGTGSDECPDDKVDQAAAGKPCTELEVVTATFNKKF